MVRLTTLAPLAALFLFTISVAAKPIEPVVDHNARLKRSTFVVDVEPSFAVSSARSPQDVTLALAGQLVGSSNAGLSVREDSYFDAAHGLWHVYLAQHIDGVKVFNGGLHAVVTGDGRVLSYSHNLYTGSKPTQETTIGTSLSDCQVPHSFNKRGQSGQMVFDTASWSVPLLRADQALSDFLAQAASISGKVAASLTDDAPTLGNVDASMAYVITDDDCLVLTHRLEVPLDDNHYEGYVDAVDGTIRAVADWTSPGMKGTPSLGRPNFSSMRGSATKAQDFKDLKGPTVGSRLPEGEYSDDGNDSDSESLEPSYKVFQWGINDPSESKRSHEFARYDPEVSPFGWHAHPANRTPFESTGDSNQIVDGKLRKYKDTRGNNVFVSWGGISNEDAWDLELPRPKGTVINGSRTFDYPYPWRRYDQAHKQLSPKEYALASQTQLFYTINEYHDLVFHYGFDGASGNFEEYSAAGGDEDAVIAFTQSKAGSNNADFSTPPNGRRGRMRMFTWSGLPERDGSFEEGIVIHEYTHGVSTRLTGGPSDSSCLGWGESGGMGEGWGDIMATLARDRNGSTPAFTMGEWASGRPGGIRHWPYSRNISISPETYETLNKPGYWAVHAAGEVWATIILDVVEHAKTDYGFSHTLFPPATTASEEEKEKFYLSSEEVAKLPNAQKRASRRPIPRHGNTLITQLLIDGMKLQPCRPDFLQARDAIVKAAENLTGGDDDIMCLLRHAFAKRGLGLDAAVRGQTPWGGGIHTNGHKKPTVCKNTRHV